MCAFLQKVIQHDNIYKNTVSEITEFIVIGNEQQFSMESDECICLQWHLK